MMRQGEGVKEEPQDADTHAAGYSDQGVRVTAGYGDQGIRVFGRVIKSEYQGDDGIRVFAGAVKTEYQEDGMNTEYQEGDMKTEYQEDDVKTEFQEEDGIRVYAGVMNAEDLEDESDAGTLG